LKKNYTISQIILPKYNNLENSKIISNENDQNGLFLIFQNKTFERDNFLNFDNFVITHITKSFGLGKSLLIENIKFNYNGYFFNNDLNHFYLIGNGNLFNFNMTNTNDFTLTKFHYFGERVEMEKPTRGNIYLLSTSYLIKTEEYIHILFSFSNIFIYASTFIY